MVSSQDPGASSETEQLSGPMYMTSGAKTAIQLSFTRHTDMANTHDEENTTPKKKAEKMMCHLGVVEVNGKGICCFLDRDTSYGGLGFVNCILRCRDAQSGLFMKFH